MFAPGPHTWRIDVGDLERRSAIFVPEAGKGLHSAVVMLHGAGATSAWTLRETQWADSANLHGFVLVCPDATPPKPNHPRRFYANPPAWNDGSPWPPASSIEADDLAFLRKVLTELPDAAGVDPKRIYVTGFSNGASMTFRLAVAMPELIAAIAPVAGHPPVFRPTPKRAVPTLFMIGTLDPFVPLAGGKVDTPWGKRIAKPPVRESLQRWRALLGCESKPSSVQEVDGVLMEHHGFGRNACIVESWFIAGLGHHWPGGSGKLSEHIAGPTSDRITATDCIWQFLKQFSLP